MNWANLLKLSVDTIEKRSFSINYEENKYF